MPATPQDVTWPAAERLIIGCLAKLMDQSTPPAILIAAFPIFFVALWCAVLLILSRIGGWRQLAESFRAPAEPQGRRFFMQSGKVGFVHYSNCLIIHTSSDGLYLSILFPFRLGHPPLFIPWQAIHDATTRRFLWIETVAIDVGSPPVAKVQLPKKILDSRGLAA